MVDFIDSEGVEWEVTEISDPVLRLIPAELLRNPEFRSGWLLFQSEHEKRRLAPFPADWNRRAESELERMCRLARLASAPAGEPAQRDERLDRR